MLNTVRSFLEAEIYPHEDMVDRTGEVPEDLGRQIETRAKEVGLYASNLPESVGGGGLNYTAMALVEREYGKTNTCPAQLDRSPDRIAAGLRGRPDRDAIWIRASRGEKRELFALTEPEAGSDVMGMKTNARRDGDDWILNGSKHFISGPCMPDFAIVFAATGVDETKRGPRKRVTAFLVDVGTPGFDCREGNKCVSYRGYKTFQLSFRQCAPWAGSDTGRRGARAGTVGQMAGHGADLGRGHLLWQGRTHDGHGHRMGRQSQAVRQAHRQLSGDGVPACRYGHRVCAPPICWWQMPCAAPMPE